MSTPDQSAPTVLTERTGHVLLITINRPKARNALDLDVYPFHVGHDGYLLFLGRMSAEKGAHRAVEVARAAGLPLRIAGKCREPLERAYFDTYVKPHLGDGIEYVGEVGHADKVELLQRARATIFPIDWEEPFGLVAAEALASGVPVLGTQRGGLAEILAGPLATNLVGTSWRSIARGIARHVENPAHGRRFGREGRRAVEASFDVARTVQGIEQVLRGVA